MVSPVQAFFFFLNKIRKILQIKKKFSTFFHFENFWSSKNFVTRLFLNTNWFALKYKMRCLNPTSVSHLFCFICSYSFYEHPLGVDIQFSVIDINLFPSSFMLQWTSKFSLFVASKHMCTFYSWSELLWTLVDTFFFFHSLLILLVTNPHPGICVRCDRTSVHMHHKFAVVDERLLITGSLNWTQTAVQRNKENILITEDPELVQPFVKEFQRLWLNNNPTQLN